MTRPGPSDELAHLLGRLVYFAGWVEHSLGELSVICNPDGLEATNSAWGLSGQRLIERFSELIDSDPTLAHVLNGYEQLASLRNKLIHSGLTPGPALVTAWHAPIRRGEVSLQSYTISLANLERHVEGWADLAIAVDQLLSEAMRDAGDGQS